MKIPRPILYTKIGCPWCAEAREVLDRQGIGYDERIVTTDASASAEMLRVSGQTKAPVLDWSGEILADFGAAELEPFLAANARTHLIRPAGTFSRSRRGSQKRRAENGAVARDGLGASREQ